MHVTILCNEEQSTMVGNGKQDYKLQHNGRVYKD
jgi:hypothetical protein